jgi:hypothetical protein
VKLVIDTTESTFEEAMAAVRAAYGLGAGQESFGVHLYEAPGPTVWSHHGGWFVQQWDAQMLHAWTQALRDTEQLATAWRICSTPGAWVTIPDIAEFLAPTGPQERALVRARSAVQVMTGLGRREIGSMGGMPFDKQEKGRSAYMGPKPVVAVVLEQIRQSPLFERLLEEYPAVGKQADGGEQ